MYRTDARIPRAPRTQPRSAIDIVPWLVVADTVPGVSCIAVDTAIAHRRLQGARRH
jgi:hypothetical protein